MRIKIRVVGQLVGIRGSLSGYDVLTHALRINLDVPVNGHKFLEFTEVTNPTNGKLGLLDSTFSLFWEVLD